MTTTPNEADPRVRRTRQLLFHAFVELWHEKGLRAISVQDVTERAQINRATFYAHFEDKFDLLANCLRERFRQILARHLPPSAGWSVEHFQRLIQSIFELLGEAAHACSPMEKEYEGLFQTTLQQEVAGILRAWFADPAFPHQFLDVPPETLATLWTSAILGVAGEWSMSEQRTPPSTMIAYILNALTPSLVSVSRARPA
jgi:AcrR family transcriptional regulator